MSRCVASSVCCLLALLTETLPAQEPERKYKANLAAHDARRVCVLLICDTEADAKIGPSVKIDLQNMKRAIQEAFKKREHLLKLDELSGAQATPQHVREYYRKLTT